MSLLPPPGTGAKRKRSLADIDNVAPKKITIHESELPPVTVREPVEKPLKGDEILAREYASVTANGRERCKASLAALRARQSEHFLVGVAAS